MFISAFAFYIVIGIGTALPHVITWPGHLTNEQQHTYDTPFLKMS
jgi:hypothetical protein